MYRARYLLVLLGGFIVEALATNAAAQPAPAPSSDVQTDKARDLHLEGDALYKKGEFAKARASYLAAWALKKQWQIAGSLADCEVKLGLHRDAAEHFAYYFRNVPPGQTPSAGAKKLYDEAKSKTGILVVQLGEPGADVKVDGVLVGTSPLAEPVFVAPGKHRVEARLGSKRAVVEVDAVMGIAESALLGLKDEAPTPTSLPAATVTASVTATVVPPAAPSKVPTFVMGGVGVLGLAAGAVFIGTGEAQKSESDRQRAELVKAEANCKISSDACTKLKATADMAATLGNAGISALVAGGLGAAGAAIYFLVMSPVSSASPHARIAPAVSSTGGGIVVIGSF